MGDLTEYKNPEFSRVSENYASLPQKPGSTVRRWIVGASCLALTAPLLAGCGVPFDHGAMKLGNGTILVALCTSVHADKVSAIVTADAQETEWWTAVGRADLNYGYIIEVGAAPEGMTTEQDNSDLELGGTAVNIYTVDSGRGTTWGQGAEYDDLRADEWLAQDGSYRLEPCG